MPVVTHPDPAERCTHFASALLSGNVVQELRDLQQLLNVKAAHVATTKGRTLRRVLEFIAVLKGSDIDNLEKLLSRWQADGVRILIGFAAQNIHMCEPNRWNLAKSEG